ncbi:hypothetical protein EPN83_01250 [Patescibacteria group bacterium]|nr:MAG: hypothetical protein EPN83_01250 [Patescibacteria group bacterium]
MSQKSKLYFLSIFAASLSLLLSSSAYAQSAMSGSPYCSGGPSAQAGMFLSWPQGNDRFNQPATYYDLYRPYPGPLLVGNIQPLPFRHYDYPLPDNTSYTYYAFPESDIWLPGSFQGTFTTSDCDATLSVTSNDSSASWTIVAGGITIASGSGTSGGPYNTRPDSIGTLYTISVSGCSSPTITNSLGGGSSLTLFPGSAQVFDIQCAPPPPPPQVSVDLKVRLAGSGSYGNGPITIPSGSNVDLSWSSFQATSCSASGGWSGSKTFTPDGTYTQLGIGPVTSNTAYSISCSGNAGPAIDFVTVNVLPAPTLIATTGTSCGGQVDLSWNSVSGATGYKIYRNGTFVIQVSGTSYTDTGLTPSTSYSYTVRTTNGTIDSLDSNTVSAVASAACVVPPPTPTGLTATPGACGTGQITLSWNTSSGATSYQLFRGGTQIYSGPGTSFIDTGLTAAASYSYTVRATNSAGSSAQSSPAVNGTAPSACAVPTADITANSSQGPITVAYGASATLRWSSTNATSCTGTNFSTGGAANNSTGVSTGALTAGSNTYSISCTGAGGTANDSVTIVTTPQVPSGLSAVTSPTCGGRINLSWNASANATSYTVYRGTASGGPYGTTVVSGLTTTTYQDSALTPGVTYYYVVRTFNANGGSANSSQASAAASAACAGPTVDLTGRLSSSGSYGQGPLGVSSGSRIDLQWAVSGATSCSASGGWSGAKTATNGTHNQTNIGPVTANTTYTLSCSNTNGTTNDSFAVNVAPTVTLTANPTTVLSGGTTTLSWTSTNAASCTASNSSLIANWSGSKTPVASGSQSGVGPINSSTSFYLDCTGLGGTTRGTATVNLSSQATINVVSNVSATWTINPGSVSGSGTNVLHTVNPAAAPGGTSYTISPGSVGGYNFPPTISNSDGSGSTMNLIPGQTKQFTLTYTAVPVFDYQLTNTCALSTPQGATVQCAIAKTLTSGSAQSVTLSASVSPSGQGVSISGYPNQSCTPTCTGYVDVAVSGSATPGIYTVTVSGSPSTATPGDDVTSFTVNVSAPPSLSVSCVASPSPAQVGQQVRWDAILSGGTGPFSYSWSGTDIPASPAPSTNPYFITYQTTGLKTADVLVTDLFNSQTTSCSGGVNGIGTVQVQVKPKFQEF